MLSSFNFSFSLVDCSVSNAVVFAARLAGTLASSGVAGGGVRVVSEDGRGSGGCGMSVNTKMEHRTLA